MKQINAVVQKLTAVCNSLSGIVLAFLVVISVVNIVGRFMRNPITGTYEIVQYGFAVIICLAVAYTALIEGHIFIDLIFKLYPPKVKIFLEFINKIVSICIFALISWRLWADGIDAYIIGETSSTLRIPVYLFQFALAAGFALMVLVIVLKLLREQG